MTHRALTLDAEAAQAAAACAACGTRALAPHLVAAPASAADARLIPSTIEYGRALAGIARCARCGHMQLDPMPDARALAQAYAEAAAQEYVEEEAGQRETARRALRSIEACLPARGRLLDAGCWVGFLLAEARDRGWATLGLEPSTFAAGYARERLGLEVVCTDLLEATLPDGAFDAVTMGDVIEHVINPEAAVLKARRLLRPGGVLWLALPDGGSKVARVLGRRWWSVLPTHVQYFTRHSIRLLLGRCGFEVVELTSAPKVFTVRYYLQRTAGYSPQLARMLVGAAAIARLDGRMWAPDFRDRMAVIARPVERLG